MLAIKKPRTSFSIPEPLIQEFRQLAGPYGEKRHWLVISAAILVLLDTDAATQQTIMAQVASADIGMGGYEGLIASAKAGELRSAIQADVKASTRAAAKGRSSSPQGQSQSQRP